MEDRRKQIPIGCAVNVAIINDLKKSCAFKRSCKRVPKRHNIKSPIPNQPWPFFNISWSSYMMYCLLVVNKELYNLNNSDSFFQNLIAKNLFGEFIVLKERHTFNTNPTYYFRSIRNAISHVNYKVIDTEIELWDHPPHNDAESQWHWHVKIDNNKLMTFLGILNEANFQLYNEINSGIRNEDGTIV